MTVDSTNGKTLLVIPPRDAWTHHRVDEVICKALNEPSPLYDLEAKAAAFREDMIERVTRKKEADE